MRRQFTLLLLGIAALLVAGCNQQLAEEGAIRTETADQLYIEVSALGSVDYFYDHKLGLEMAGTVLGVKTEYVGPADRDMAAMVTAFEQAIVKKPNGIVVVGFENVLVPIINKAVEAGIPVVTVDADLPESKRIAFVGTGNIEAGRVCARTLVKLTGGKGKVAFMTIPGQSNLDDRMIGYKEELANHPEIEVVQTVDVQGDPTIAAQAAATLLQKYPDLAALACVEAVGGAGAAVAVKEAGKAGQVKILAMDRGNEVIQFIKEGVISATIAQQTALMPYYAVQILYNLNNVDIPMTTDNKAAGISGVPGLIDTGVVVVDQSNYQYFVRK